MKKIRKLIALCCCVVLVMCSSVIISAQSVDDESFSQYTVVTKSYETDKVTSRVVIPQSTLSAVEYENQVTPARMPSTKAYEVLGIKDENSIDTTSTRIVNRMEVDENQYPYCAIGRVESKWMVSDTEMLIIKGTGCLEGPDVVLTCAHIIYHDEYGWSEETWFYPGQTSDTVAGRPIQSQAINISIARSFIDAHKDDWAIMRVEDDLGYLGWFGKGVATSTLIGTKMVSSGYRAGVSGRQIKTSGTVQRLAQDYDSWVMHLSGIDGNDGCSGGPIYHEDNRIVRGIYNFGGGYYDGGGRAIDSWLYNMLQEAYLEGVEKWGY